MTLALEHSSLFESEIRNCKNWFSGHLLRVNGAIFLSTSRSHRLDRPLTRLVIVPMVLQAFVVQVPTRPLEATREGYYQRLSPITRP